MANESKAHLDATDQKLLRLLRDDARLSFAELGRKVKLSAPAAAERVKRLEDRGVIRGYRAEINLAALGRGLHVYFRVVVAPKEYGRFNRMIEAIDDICECHHVTGEESFILRAAVRDVPFLERLIQKLTAFGPTTTSVVLSTPLDRRNFVPEQR